jgi:hypothetical protein
VASTAAARASATERHPENLSRWIARRAGPWNRNAARATSIDGGGQSRHDVTGRSEGRPQRSHHGGVSATNEAEQDRQNGQGPAPHPAHERGKTTSRASDHTAAP